MLVLHTALQARRTRRWLSPGQCSAFVAAGEKVRCRQPGWLATEATDLACPCLPRWWYRQMGRRHCFCSSTSA
eukprot:3806566-Rhodomonas_salina.1